MLAALSVQTTEEGEGRRQELERLLIRTGRGEQDAFVQLYTRTRGAVYALALSLLCNVHEALSLIHI